MAPTPRKVGAPQYRVLLVEDHPMMVLAVKTQLGDNGDFELVVADTAERAVAAFAPGEFDAVVVDLGLPDRSGLWVIRKIREADGGVPVCVFSSDLTDPEAALEAGADGFLSKYVDDDFADKIRSLLAGEQVFDESASNVLLHHYLDGSKLLRKELTLREREILALMAAGASADDMARHLHLSPHTVRSAMKTMYPKLGVNDRAAAVATGFRRGLIS